MHLFTHQGKFQVRIHDVSKGLNAEIMYFMFMYLMNP